MPLTIDTDIDIMSKDNARQMLPMLGCRSCSRAARAARKSAERQFVQCARVTHYFAFAAVGAVFGAVDLRGTADETLHVPPDHPPVREGVTQDMPVCDTNTTTFANPVYSRPFVPAAGDTVFYFLDGLIESPDLLARRHR
jgi:hypothetical protein